jgi:TonB family protein
MEYMDRLKISLLISFFVHLLLIWLLPGPVAFEPDVDTGQKTEIQLAYRNIPVERSAPQESEPEEKEEEEVSEKQEDTVEDEMTEEESEPQNFSPEEIITEEPRPEEYLEPEKESGEPETEDKTNEVVKPRANFLRRDGLIAQSFQKISKSDQSKSSSVRGLPFNTQKYSAGEKKTSRETDTAPHRLLEEFDIEKRLLSRQQEDTAVDVDFDELPDFTSVVIDQQQAQSETYLQPRSLLREPVNRPYPEMPDWLEEKGEEVRIVVEYWINREGYVEEMSILQSSGHRELDAEVLDAMSRWRYTPGSAIVRQVAVFNFVLKQ